MTNNIEQQLKKKLSDMDARFQKNLEFFRRQAPSIYNQVKDCKKKPELSIDSLEGGISRKIDGVPAYPEGSVQHAINEVQHFMETMDKSVYAPLPGNIDLTHLIKPNAFSKTAKNYAELIIQKGRVQINPNNIDIFVFGVGLGYHVEMLCNLNKFSNITIIENETANFVASMYAMDWEKITKSLKNHASITFHIKDNNKDDEAFERTLRAHCHRLFPSIGISTLIYNHLPDSKNYNKAKAIINEYATHVKVSSELIGPEAQRLFNAVENLKNEHPCLDLEKSYIEDNKKVCIVGAGPSLDIYSAMLKQHRDQFFLISAGSTLSSLLRMGIKPDLHFELEFQNLATEWITHINNDYPLSDLNLVCTYEANPDFPPLFNKAYMFIPESSELQQVFKPSQILRRGGITCTNGATALASQLTDKPIYLFGLDFAYTGGEHHSASNISRDNNLPDKLKKIKTVADSRKATNLVPGNQDDQVPTSTGLNSARLTIENLFESISNKIYNCSHGAKIRGAEFLSIAALEEQLTEATPETTPETSDAAVTLVTEQIEIERIFTRVDEVLSTSLKATNRVVEMVNSFTDNAKENNRLSKTIFNEILKFAAGDPGKARNIMSVSKYPLLQLFIITNYLDNDDQKIILTSWMNEYQDYVHFLDELFSSRKNERNYAVPEDWMK